MKIQLQNKYNWKNIQKMKNSLNSKLLLLINRDKSSNIIKSKDKPRSLISHRVPMLKC